MPMNEKPKARATDLDPAGVANLVNAMFEDRIPVITRLASCADFLSAARATGPQCRPADGWTHIGRRHLGDRFGECDQVHALEMVHDVAADAGQMNRPCLLQPRQACGREHRHLATAIALSPNPLNEPLA